MTTTAQPRRVGASAIVCGAVIVIAAIAAFRPLLRADFTNFDDDNTVADNPRIVTLTLASLAWQWRNVWMDLYVPVTYSAWWTVALVSPRVADLHGKPALDPRWFHALNLTLHVLSALVVFVILRRLFTRDWVACAGALMFALHPIQVEPVAWVSGLKDVLCGLLCLVAIWQYIRFATARSAPSYALALLAFVCAMLSKPTAVVLPVALLIIDRAMLRREWRDVARGVVPCFILAIPFTIVAKLAQPAPGRTTLVSPALRPLVAMDSLAFYLSKVAVPVNLGPDYGRTPRFVVQRGWVWSTWVAPVGTGIIAWLARRRLPLFSLGLLLALVPLLPILGFVRFDFQEISGVADHYLYLSMFGLALAACALLNAAGEISATIAAGLLVLLGILSFRQTLIWQNSRTLFEHAVALNPQSWIGWNNLAQTAIESADFVAGREYAQRSADLKPDFADAHVNLGNALMQSNQHALAIEHLERAVRLSPNMLQARLNLAAAYGMSERISDAVTQYEAALRIDPGCEVALRMLPPARAYLHSKKSAPDPDAQPAPSR
ncbi:MAG: tetratricopeptide repeat protein [Tepidisphaeraceae bacterium]